ncbi:MAG: ATP-binding protein [Candidatus Saccharibacteria bacterium]|nr:ATP-binding protein [Candidatus Saccharibacteria bacterium]
MSSGQLELEANNQYNRLVNDVMFKLARLTPLIILVYGLLVQFGIVRGSELYSWQAFVGTLVAIGIAALVQTNDFRQPPMLHFSFYLISLTFTVFVMGFPLVTLFWTVLSVSTFLNFGRRAYYWSTLLLISFALLDAFLLWQLHGVSYLLDNLTIVACAMLAATILVEITRAQTKDHDRLINTRHRESLQYSRMQALINGLSDAIISFDNKGVIKLYNSAALNLLDTNKSLTGQNIDDVVKLYNSKASTSKSRASLFQVVSSENRQLESEDYMHRFEDGEEIRLNIVSAPIRNSFGKDRASKEGYIAILRDITKVKSLEEERDEFISVISHELRTPITITEGTISNMMFFAQKNKADEGIVKGLGEAHDQVVYLAKMINDLSALSRAERGAGLEQENLNVDEFAHSLYQEYSPQAKNAGLTMDLDVPGNIGEIHTSKLYIEEILQNLITNAIKYTTKGSVTLKIRRVEGGVSFAVIDTGHGISKTDQKKVFQKFYRSEDYRTRETGGTGLGLYVAGKLSNKIGTRIKLESRLNHGSTFSFVLPTQKLD